MFTNDNAAPTTRHHTPLLSIGPHRCRFIVSEGTRDAISDLSSWCAHHARIVYEPRLTAAEREQRRAA